MTDLHRYFPVIERDNAGDAYAIEYRSLIDKVAFERYNSQAGVAEEVLVPWQQAFRWADADPCGGVVVAVYMKDNIHAPSRRWGAESRWQNPDYHSAPIGSDGKPKHCLIAVFRADEAVLRRTFDISPELREKFGDGPRYHVQAIPAARKAAGLAA